MVASVKYKFSTRVTATLRMVLDLSRLIFCSSNSLGLNTSTVYSRLSVLLRNAEKHSK